MFLSAKAIQNMAVSRPQSKPSAGAQSSITFSTSMVKAKGRAAAKYFTVNIGGKIAKEAGLKIGDFVNLQFDPEDKVGLIIPDSQGWKLSGSAPNKQGLQTLRLRFTWHVGLPSIDGKGECNDILVERPQTVQFGFPKGTEFPVDQDAAEHNNKPVTLALQKSIDRREHDRRGVRFGRRASDIVLVPAETCTEA